jgi:hypothetical protein
MARGFHAENMSNTNRVAQVRCGLVIIHASLCYKHMRSDFSLPPVRPCVTH